jgi:hypothetical protein
LLGIWIIRHGDRMPLIGTHLYHTYTVCVVEPEPVFVGVPDLLAARRIDFLWTPGGPVQRRRRQSVTLVSLDVP